jgi:zinc protease
VLSDGQSSRIYRKLVYDTGLALTAFGQANLIEHPNLFYAVAIVNPGQSPQAVEKALIAEMERIKTEGVTDRELQRSKNQFLRDYVLGRETVQQKATHLAHAEVAHADVTTAESEFDIFQNITLADVMRVAKTYFKPESRVVLHIMPKGGVQ